MYCAIHEAVLELLSAYIVVMWFIQTRFVTALIGKTHKVINHISFALPGGWGYCTCPKVNFKISFSHSALWLLLDITRWRTKSIEAIPMLSATFDVSFLFLPWINFLYSLYYQLWMNCIPLRIFRVASCRLWDLSKSKQTLYLVCCHASSLINSRPFGLFPL